MPGQGRISEENLEPMVRALDHRGPDEKGIYLDPNMGLGHARLSLIDLTSGGQPIGNEDQTVWTVLNGEIYNYRELRAELEQKGHRFYTHTDTEVIVHLYEEDGPDCVDRFNGQFAFAVWDRPKQTLLLARDRFGICPLYYAEHNGYWLFASEVKALLASNLLPSPRLDEQALDQVFTFWAPLPGRTLFRNIHELKPGHTLTLDARQPRLRRYWDFPYRPPEALLRESPRQIAGRILELLKDATGIRLQADVAVGSYLSGGLDSSGVTALIVRHFNREVRTFGLRFQDREFDEGPFQNEMAAFLGVDHHELTASNALIAETFPRVVWHCETPILRTAPVPMYLLSRFVKRQGIKVVCTGEGADEVFGGYDIFREALVRRFVSRRPDSPRRARLLEQLYPQIFRTSRGQKVFRQFILQDSTALRNPLFSHLSRWNNTSRIKRLFSKRLQSDLLGYSAIDELVETLPEDFSCRDLLSQAQYLEETIFMSQYLLSSQGDRMAMAHGVEIRPPYLDHRIVDFMSAVPPIWKILGLDEKHILKKTYQDVLPSSITRRTKQPYRAPIQKAFLGQLNSESYRHLLSEKQIADIGLFDPVKVSGLFQKMESKAAAGEIEGMAVAGVLSTHILFEQYLKSAPTPTAERIRWNIRIDRRTP